MKKFLLALLLPITLMAQKPRVDFGQRNEPKGTILFGAGQNDLESFNGFASAVGFTPSFYMGYLTLGGSFNYMFSQLKANTVKLPKGVALQIGLGFAGAGNSTKAANGSYDSQVKSLSDWLKTLDRNAYIRIGYEFDFKDNKYLRADFITAFIRFANILRANKNTSTVWCSSGGSGSATAVNTRPWYPGDAVVDAWGWDLFNEWELRPNEIGRATQFFDSATAHKKPVMIGEVNARGVGVLKGADSWSRWFKPFFELVYNSPAVKFVSWINQDGKEHANDYPGAGVTGNSKLQDNEYVRGAFTVAALALKSPLASIPLYDTTIIKIPITRPVTKYITQQRIVVDTLSRYVVSDTIGTRDSTIITPRAASIKVEPVNTISIGYSTPNKTTGTNSGPFGEAALIERIRIKD